MTRHNARSLVGGAPAWLLAALLLAAAPAARAAAGGRSSPGPDAGADAHARRRGRARTPRPSPRRSPGWTSTASPCSTWATRLKQNDPNWFDVLRPTKLPAYAERVRRGRPLLRRRPAEPARRQGLHPDRPRRDQDDLRVRAVRHRRRRRPDDVPPAPRLRRARADRRRPDLEPVHGPRRLPELDRVLGPERHGVLPQRAAALDAVAERRLELHDRARAAGGERRPGRLRRPHRAAGRQGALPAAGLLRALPQARADWGHVQVAGIAAGDQVGRPQQRPVRPQRQRNRLGHQRQLEPEAREARVRGCRSSTATASRTT